MMLDVLEYLKERKKTMALCICENEVPIKDSFICMTCSGEKRYLCGACTMDIHKRTCKIERFDGPTENSKKSDFEAVDPQIDGKKLREIFESFMKAYEEEMSFLTTIKNEAIENKFLTKRDFTEILAKYFSDMKNLSLVNN